MSPEMSINPRAVVDEAPDQGSDSSLSDPPFSERNNSSNVGSAEEELREQLYGTVNPNNPENAFHNFHKLPKELQLMIWKEIIFTPRIVHIVMLDHDPYSTRDRKLVSNNYMPVVLQINRESRTEALKHYTLDLAARDQKGQIYFNHAVDTVFFEVDFGKEYKDPSPLFDLFMENREKDNKIAEIKRLALAFGDAFAAGHFSDDDYRSEDMKFLPGCGKLEELTLFCRGLDYENSSVSKKRGDLVSYDPDVELGDKKTFFPKTTFEELQTILEKAVAEDHPNSGRNAGCVVPVKGKDWKPPKVKIMNVKRLPKAWSLP